MVSKDFVIYPKEVKKNIIEGMTTTEQLALIKLTKKLIAVGIATNCCATNHPPTWSGDCLINGCRS